jgi:hypothetical protein
MRFTRLVAAFLVAVVAEVNANTEKVIFTAPNPVTIPAIRPGLDDLHLDILSPAGLRVLENSLDVQFPTEAAPRGVESWYLLKDLEAGRRYEVRICWPATVSYTRIFFWLLA